MAHREALDLVVGQYQRVKLRELFCTTSDALSARARALTSTSHHQMQVLNATDTPRVGDLQCSACLVTPDGLWMMRELLGLQVEKTEAPTCDRWRKGCRQGPVWACSNIKACPNMPFDCSERGHANRRPTNSTTMRPNLSQPSIGPESYHLVEQRLASSPTLLGDFVWTGDMQLIELR